MPVNLIRINHLDCNFLFLADLCHFFYLVQYAIAIAPYNLLFIFSLQVITCDDGGRFYSLYFTPFELICFILGKCMNQDRPLKNLTLFLLAHMILIA